MEVWVRSIVWHLVIPGCCGISTLDSGPRYTRVQSVKICTIWAEWTTMVMTLGIKREIFRQKVKNSITFRAVSLKLVLLQSLWVPARLGFFIHELAQRSSLEGSFSLTSGKNKHLFRCFRCKTWVHIRFIFFKTYCKAINRPIALFSHAGWTNVQVCVLMTQTGLIKMHH